MADLLQSAALRLDGVRVGTLRLTLAVPAFRRAFVSRPLRLGLLFLAALAVYLPLSLLFPLWVLAIGPVVFGVPHLFASLRYSHRTAAGNATPPAACALWLFGALYGGVIACRYLIDFRHLDLTPYGIQYDTAEWLALLLTFAAGAWIYRRSPMQRVPGAVVLAGVLFASWYWPYGFLGAILLLHNLVAFLFWVKASPAGTERRVAWSATAIFVGVNVLLFAGVFDWLGVAESYLPWAGIDAMVLGHGIAPWSEDSLTWYHCIVAYAFGQSIHYFVWMKAIPDQHHTHAVPTTFRQSLDLLRRDFGRNGVLAIVALTAITGLAWFLFHFPTARAAYFALASYHGFLEIGLLCLVLGRR